MNEGEDNGKDEEEKEEGDKDEREEEEKKEDEQDEEEEGSDGISNSSWEYLPGVSTWSFFLLLLSQLTW